MTNHLAWLRFRKNLANGMGDSYRFDAARMGDRVKTRFATRAGFEFAYYLKYGFGLDKQVSKDPEKQQLTRTLHANAIRMNIYLVIDEIERTGQVYNKAFWKNIAIGDWLDNIMTPMLRLQNGGNLSQADQKMLGDLDDAIDGACEAKSDANNPMGPRCF